MNWAAILPAVRALLVKLTGLQVFERDSPPQMTNPALKAKLEFAVVGCSTVGRDERHYEYSSSDPDPNRRVTLTIRGVRQFTLQVKCTSYDHGPLVSAEYWLERVRTKLAWPSSQQALNAVGTSWTGCPGSYQNLSAVGKQEDRVWSVGVLDFQFTAAVIDSTPPDSADSPIGTIDSVELTSVYLRDSSGTPLAKQIGPDVIGP